MPNGGWIPLFAGEAIVAEYFRLCGEEFIPCRESQTIGHNMKYVPDFYLPRLDLYVEVKNRNPMDVDDYEYAKIRMFWDHGNQVYVMRSPHTSPLFVQRDFDNSRHIYNSSIYVKGFDERHPVPVIFQRDPQGGIKLAEFRQGDGFTLFNEATTAFRTDFDSAYGE